jgi:hypothetical protein
MAATPLVNQSLLEPQEQPLCHPHYVRSEELGDEITELCGYIYAATYQLLVKIHSPRELSAH